MRTSVVHTRCSPRSSLLCLCVMALLLPAAGCTRAHYRRRADHDAYKLIGRANCAVRTPLPDYSIQPAPPSRFFDPNCPDLPPMPPDDPMSHRLMHWVDRKRGWPGWRCYGKTPFVENPAWKALLPVDEDGVLVLDRRCAVQVALIHSPGYQRELEDLYLSALDVSFERFRFDAQFFGGNDTFFTADGPDRAVLGGDSSSELSVDTEVQMTKLFCTGAELVVGMANSLVWQFAGPDDYVGASLLDFTLVQPLLRAGGRAVVLEALTDRERALLANIRQMERFRRSFYTQVVVGRSPDPGPSRAGIDINSITRATGLGAGGLIALLEDRVGIGNQQFNVTGLRKSLEQLAAAYEAGRIDRLQVDQARQALYNAQSRLLGIETNYEDALDAYKIALGLPPDLEVRIEDSLLEGFTLIDPRLSATQSAIVDLLEVLRDPDRPAEPTEYLPTLASLKEETEAALERVEQDVQSLQEILPTRRADLQRLSSREEILQGNVDPGAVAVEALDERATAVEENFRMLRGRIRRTLASLDAIEQAGPQPPREELIAAVDDLSTFLMELSLVQAAARLDTITLVPVELKAEVALRIARDCRRDWRNARAALVDQWRLIELAANDLESDLDVVFSGDVSTVDERPFRFRGTTGRLRVGLEFDAPLTRLEERNSYRETLINYQQARRAYYTFEDTVNQSLRRTLRAMRQIQLDFELERAAVLVAISQVELTQLRLQQPPKQGEGSQFGATTARDLVQALSGLLSAQDGFVRLWVDYEVQRMNLDLDLGTMALDPQGMWIDPGPIRREADDSQDEAFDFEEVPLGEPMPLPELIQTPERIQTP